MKDAIGPVRVTVPEEQPEVVRRLNDALALDIATNNPPRLHRVPVVLCNWDFRSGILRIAHALHSELDTHIVYMRIGDLQQTLAEVMRVSAVNWVTRDELLKKLGAVMAGQAARIVGPES
jgi:hypothetical protein